jgi:phosphoglycerate kinase
MKYIRDIENLNAVVSMVRTDFNVPVANGKVVDDFRIRKSLPTIEYLRSKGAKVVLISHIENDNPTLSPIVPVLEDLGVPVVFVKNYRNAREEIDKMSSGAVILLENLRDHDGEKENDEKFAKELASLADVYINDAFSVCHREHASVSAITKFIPSYAGLLLEQEINHLSTAFNPPHPFLFILGGAKFSTKLPLIKRFIDIADKLFVGGALANNFYKESGVEIGISTVSPEDFGLSEYMKSGKIILPPDGIAVSDRGVETKSMMEIARDEKVLDAGPETMKILEREISSAKYILWNGPTGNYELGYKETTIDLAKMLAKATSNGVTTIVGGGDTLATIAELKNVDQYTFVSTGGGAMLDFLSSGTLPGIKALG